MTESRRQVLLLLQQFNQGRRTDSVWLLWYQTVWVSPLKMNQGDCFWISPPTPEYYCYIWEPGTTHLISKLFSSICDVKILPLPCCWHSPESLKCQRLRSLPTQNLICLFVVKLLVLWKENQINAHRFRVLHGATVINHPNGTSWSVLCRHHSLCVHVHIHEWDELSKKNPDVCFYGKISCKRHAQSSFKDIRKSAGYRFGHVVVGISTLIRMYVWSEKCCF